MRTVVLRGGAEVERPLHPDASLSDAASAIPWESPTQLIEAFAGIRESSTC